MKINSYSDFLDFGAVEESSIRYFNRNDVGTYSIGNKLVVLKRFKNEESARREGAAYAEFLDNPVVQVPFRHFAEEDVALYDYVEATEQADPFRRIIDWAQVHNRRELTDIFEMRNPKRKELAKTIERVRKRADLFGANNNLYADCLEEHLEEFIGPLLTAFTHGDMRVNNSISTTNGTYYIDFEFSGVSHPAVDIVPTLLAYPRISNEIVRAYNAHSDFKPWEIEKSLPLYTVFRGIHVVAMQEKRKIKDEIRLPVRDRFVEVMDGCLK